MSKDSIIFDDALSDSDYGLIVCGKTGKLKGIWVPDGSEDDVIPDTIANLCVHFFGVNPNRDNEGNLH